MLSLYVRWERCGGKNWKTKKMIEQNKTKKEKGIFESIDTRYLSI